MKFLLATWTGRFVSLFLLTLLMAVGGYIIDPAYFQNPLGEGEIGLVAADGYSMPATSEIEVVANGVDPLQIDLKSSDGDFSGLIEVVDPAGNMVLSSRFALRFFPKSFMPNHEKWQTFYAPAVKKGTYLLRMTQNTPGKAKIYFYQGPFIVRMLTLPAIAAFFLMATILTISPSNKKEKILVEIDS